MTKYEKNGEKVSNSRIINWNQLWAYLTENSSFANFSLLFVFFVCSEKCSISTVENADGPCVFMYYSRDSTPGPSWLFSATYHGLWTDFAKTPIYSQSKCRWPPHQKYNCGFAFARPQQKTIKAIAFEYTKIPFSFLPKFKAKECYMTS